MTTTCACILASTSRGGRSGGRWPLWRLQSPPPVRGGIARFDLVCAGDCPGRGDRGIRGNDPPGCVPSRLDARCDAANPPLARSRAMSVPCRSSRGVSGRGSAVDRRGNRLSAMPAVTSANSFSSMRSQALKMKTPPGRSTRRVSANALGLSGKNITPNWQTDRVERVASVKGSCIASAWRHSTARAVPMRGRAVDHRLVQIRRDDRARLRSSAAPSPASQRPCPPRSRATRDGASRVNRLREVLGVRSKISGTRYVS